MFAKVISSRQKSQLARKKFKFCLNVMTFLIQEPINSMLKVFYNEMSKLSVLITIINMGGSRKFKLSTHFQEGPTNLL